MRLLKIKNPVEYSFIQWINDFHATGHWLDKARFFNFVKTVCRYNAKKWKSQRYLIMRILNRQSVDPDVLEKTLDLYKNLLDFYDAIPITSVWQITRRPVKRDHYIAVKIKDEEIVYVEMPLKRRKLPSKK